MDNKDHMEGFHTHDKMEGEDVVAQEIRKIQGILSFRFFGRGQLTSRFFLNGIFIYFNFM